MLITDNNCEQKKSFRGILNPIQSIQQDVNFLVGDTPQMLLEKRMEQVMFNKIINDSQSVYVQVFTKEYDLKNKKEKDEITPLFNSNNQIGQVEKFLGEQEQSSLLIHGIAGAGKSLSAIKIEEYLWIKYQQVVQNKLWDQAKDVIIIPIFIQLPFLKYPNKEAVEETLRSSIYSFHSSQIEQLKVIVQASNKIKLLFIMDSYDELAKEYQQIHQIQTNNINQWKDKLEKSNPKVITTSRSEIFTDNYIKWFSYQDNIRFSQIEIRLLSFDKEQRFVFLQQHSQLQLKLKIKEFLEVISKNKRLDYIMENIRIIYDKIKQLINHDGQYILSNEQSQDVINTIKLNPNFLQMDIDQENQFIQQIQILWSVKQYEQIIKQLNLNEMLETPFLMNIVVAILPQMKEKLFSKNQIEITFKQQYQKNKIAQINDIISNFECQKLNYKDYDRTEIQVLKKIREDDQFLQEISQIWDYLNESNFFQHNIALKECIDIIDLIEQSIGKNMELTSITKKENTNKKNYLVIYNSLVMKTETVYDFYKEFMNNYIELQIKKLSYGMEKDQRRFLLDINYHAKELAIIMTKQNKTVIEIKQYGNLQNKNTKNDPYYEFFDKYDQQYYYRILIRKCLPIKQKENLFQFHHKSIQEYLVASYIIEFLSQISIDNQLQQIIDLRNQNKMFKIEDFDVRDRDFLNLLFDNHLNQDLDLSSQQMYGQMRFIKAGIQYQSNLKNTSYLLSLLSSICTLFIKLSSNALYLYTYVLLNIENKDFKRINVENISLDGINFFNCNFSWSFLKKVSINGINLNQSDLSNCSWVDCYSNDLPNFKVIQQKIICLCFSTIESRMITGHENGTFSEWDKNQVILLNQLMTVQPYKNLIGIIHLYDSDQIQFAIFHDLQYKQLGQLLTVDFVKIKNGNTFELVQNIHIYCEFNLSNIMQSFSLNCYFFIYRKENEMKAYDLNTRETYGSLFQNQISYFQIRDDNNLVYIIFYKFKEDICVWNIGENTKSKIRINKIKEYKELLCEEGLTFKFNRNCKFLAIQSSLDFYLFNFEANNHIQFNLKDVYVFEFSQNQEYLAMGGDYLIIFDIQNQTITQKLYGFNQLIITIIFSQNLKEILTLSKDGVVKYWDLEQCLQNTKQITTNFQQKIDDIQYSINGRLYYIQISNRIYVYDSTTGLLIDLLDLKVTMFRISPIKEELLYQYERVWHCYSYNFKKTSKLDIKSKSNLVISENGKLIWTYDNDAEIIQMDDYHKVLPVSKKFVGQHPCFSKDSQTLYYYDEGEKYLMSILFKKPQNTETYKLQWEIKFKMQKQVINILLSPDEKVILIIQKHVVHELFIYCIATRKKLQKMEPSGYQPYKISFSSEGKYLLIGLQQVIRIYHYQTFKQSGEDLFGHSPYTKQLIVNPNGQQFITLGDDNKIKIWETNKHFQQQNPYYLKQTIAQKSTQIVNIHDTIMDNAKITSHLGYNIYDVWVNQFYHFKFENLHKKITPY